MPHGSSPPDCHLPAICHSAPAMLAAAIGPTCWTAPQYLVLGSDAQHGLREVLANTQLVRSTICRGHRAAACSPASLLAPYTPDRAAGILFAIRRSGITEEHIVGGDMQQRNAGRSGSLRQMRHTLGIHRMRALRLALGLVHCGVSRRVDDERRLQTGAGFCYLHAIADIQLGGGQADGLDASRRLAQQFMADLTAGSGDEYAHGLICAPAADAGSGCADPSPTAAGFPPATGC